MVRILTHLCLRLLTDSQNYRRRYSPFFGTIECAYSERIQSYDNVPSVSMATPNSCSSLRISYWSRLHHHNRTRWSGFGRLRPVRLWQGKVRCRRRTGSRELALQQRAKTEIGRVGLSRV